MKLVLTWFYREKKCALMVFPAKRFKFLSFLFLVERDANVNYILAWYKRTIHLCLTSVRCLQDLVTKGILM